MSTQPPDWENNPPGPRFESTPSRPEHLSPPAPSPPPPAPGQAVPPPSAPGMPDGPWSTGGPAPQPDKSSRGPLIVLSVAALVILALTIFGARSCSQGIEELGDTLSDANGFLAPLGAQEAADDFLNEVQHGEYESAAALSAPECNITAEGLQVQFGRQALTYNIEPVEYFGSTSPTSLTVNGTINVGSTEGIPLELILQRSTNSRWRVCAIEF